ncbi:MAG TPA: isoprenylcysteine carboxylmethyltransferase family protein [Candidatus Eisenbacteria bacterium]|nr:isoprenylcysteine carboxylmethyltransferase family protein [Candidatus Eisenbacteria bacterium]
MVQLLRDHSDQVAPSAVHRTLVRFGEFLFSGRNLIFPFAFLAIAAVSFPRAPFESERADLILDAVGLSVAVAGQTLRAVVIGLAYIRRGGKGKKIHADRLVQDGIFAHSRNPLYVGNMMVFLGLFIVLNSTWGYLVGVPFFYISYLSITLAEEEFLRKRFGEEYVDYCRRVNRFLPSWKGIAATMRSMSFDWGRLIRKEYGSTFIWITAALWLLLWEAAVRQGWDSVRPRARVLAAVWVVALAAYLVARYLKKTGRLSAQRAAG